VLVTDHHLPTEAHPDALAIVNPNQHGCSFPSKSLAGCGVIYYVMWALQDEFVARGSYRGNPNFSVDSLLPIVAVGTVADVVKLDYNNRILVSAGVNLIRKNHSFPGLEALAKVSKRNPRVLATSDIAFGIGPRINAAGRLESMDAGVETLTTDSVARADALAKILHEINDRRKEIELDMTEEAVRRLLTDVREDRFTAVLHSDEWHQGVIGIVAGRIKERVWRPTFALATGKNGELKGSGRSIPALHLRDALDLVDKRCPGLLLKFGGHAMAAGVTLRAGGLDEFSTAFEAVVRTLITKADLLQELEVDGGLHISEMTLDTVARIKEGIWGQGFLEPVFCDEFTVKLAKPIGGGLHLRMVLEKDGREINAVRFRHGDGALPPSRIRAAYKLDVNTFKDENSLQLLIEHFEAA
jgi:single-stranded-DNA-specific exonuclease